MNKHIFCGRSNKVTFKPKIVHQLITNEDGQLVYQKGLIKGKVIQAPTVSDVLYAASRLKTRKLERKVARRNALKHGAWHRKTKKRSLLNYLRP